MHVRTLNLSTFNSGALAHQHHLPSAVALSSVEAVEVGAAGEMAGVEDHGVRAGGLRGVHERLDEAALHVEDAECDV